MTSHRWPGLIDLQVNGFRGHDVNADDVTAETIVALTRALWAEGVTRYLPTVITASEEKILHVLAAIIEARSMDALIAHSIAGIHVEGPSLAPDDGPRGAHDINHLRDPSIDELDRWQQASGDLIRIVTLAPEREGSLPYIADAASRGIRVSLGHCAASPEHIREAVRAGATLSTHLGNGAHATLPRHPNHIWAQLAADELTAMFIADGHHLPADAVTAMIRAKGVPRSILTSDSAALAGSPAGDYLTPVGGSVTVSADGQLSVTGTKLLAGSGRSLRQCVAWARRALPFDDDELLAMSSRNPARLLGINMNTDTDGDSLDVELGDDVVVRTVRVAGAVVHEGTGAAA
ncbi:N-acetylglucosamine-6-phosphate deacetylase [Microbacterium sp. A84]|uniref:N-acetylglucosamine-6-phosphate deacetylase n=1 Tax=Microbacterium sp. A84 TaxID=3450715 RepID=UPI003F425EFC